MKKCLGLSMLIIGTIVGAGFASGREIVAFFGTDVSLWVAPLSGVLFFCFSVLFLSIGTNLRKSNISEANLVILGKYHIFADIFLLLNGLVVLAGMLSAMDTLLSLIFPLAPLYSILSGILCAVVVSKGLRAILKCNIFIVPLTIIVLVIISVFNISDALNPAPFFTYSLWATLMYVSMNMMLASAFFVTINDTRKKIIIIASAIASLVLSALMFLLIIAINSGAVGEYAMPMLELAKRLNKPLFFFCIAIIALSIFTTMLTSMNTLNLWVQTFGGGDLWSIIVVLIAGLIVSNLGFENVVGYLYPIIGVVGIVYITLSIIYVVKDKCCKKRCDYENTTLF